MTSMELFDLVELTAGHAKDDRFAKLRRFVRHASSMNSVLLDVRKAAAMMRTAWEMQAPLRSRGADESDYADQDLALTLQALFGQALLLYTRATHSRGKGRNKLEITAELDDEMRSLHDRLVMLRDRHLAHFEGLSSWEEHETVLVLDIEQERMALNYPHQVYYLRADDAGALNRLLTHALGIAEKAYEASSERLSKELNDLFETDPKFIDELRKHRFNPSDAFMGDEVDEYLSAISEDRPVSLQARIVRARGKGKK